MQAGAKATAIVTLIILFALPGCKIMRDLMAFQKAIAAEFDEAHVGVHITATDLTVVFPASRATGLTSAERREFAKRVGVFARDHYPRYKSLTTVIVTFKDQKQIGPVTVTSVADTFKFRTSELDAVGDFSVPTGEFKRINHTVP